MWKERSTIFLVAVNEGFGLGDDRFCVNLVGLFHDLRIYYYCVQHLLHLIDLVRRHLLVNERQGRVQKFLGIRRM